MAKNILSLDAGGIRGVMTLEVLKGVEKCLEMSGKGSIRDYFDMVVGTSTGGIISAMLLHPEKRYTASEISDFYFKEADRIFYKDLWYNLRSMWGLLSPRYKTSSFEKVVYKMFGDTEVKSLTKPCVINSFDIKGMKPLIFKSHKAKDSGKHNFMLRDAVLSTAAAPTYFKARRVVSDDHTRYIAIDGGVYSTNPSMIAYTEAKKVFKTTDIRILSIGTGFKDRLDEDDIYDKGLLGWTVPISSIMMDSGKETASYEADAIMNDSYTTRYLRIDGELPSDIDPRMDLTDRDNMQKLKKFGYELYIKEMSKIMKFIK